MNHNLFVITSLYFKDKFSYAYRLMKKYKNYLCINIKRELKVHRYVLKKDIKGFIEHISFLKDSCDCVLILYPDKEVGLRKFLSDYRNFLPFDIIYADDYYINKLFAGEKRINIRTNSCLDYYKSLQEFSPFELWERAKKNKLSIKDDNLLKTLFNSYLFLGGILTSKEKFRKCYFQYNFSPFHLISTSLNDTNRHIIIKEDFNVFNMILRNINFGRLYFPFNAFKTRYSAIKENLERLRFNGYIDIVQRVEKRSYNIMQIVPQDVGQIISFNSHSYSQSLGYDIRVQYGLVQTFVINELARKYNKVSFVKGEKDYRIGIAAGANVYHINYSHRSRVPEVILDFPGKKFIVYNGVMKYDEENDVYFIPFHLLSFVIDELTQKAKCKN